MEQWCEIRQRVLRDGESIRQIQRETGLHFDTIKKILAHPTPPAFRTPVRVKPKLGPYLERIAAILDSDRELPRKQRHTAKRIFERLRDEGYSGGYTQVKEAVRELKRSGGEVFVPLVQEPGEAQVGFGYALVKLAGSLSKVAFFALELPYSDAMFIAAYPRECTETFQDGHVRAFGFLQGVPRRIGYDNARTSVAQITGARRRKLTTGFLQLQSHYLFDECFCRVGRPNEKGVVEGIVKYARLNYFVPVPQFDSFEELNAHLEQRCREDLGRRVRGQKAIKRTMESFTRSWQCATPSSTNHWPANDCSKKLEEITVSVRKLSSVGPLGEQPRVGGSCLRRKFLPHKSGKAGAPDHVPGLSA